MSKDTESCDSAHDALCSALITLALADTYDGEGPQVGHALAVEKNAKEVDHKRLLYYDTEIRFAVAAGAQAEQLHSTALERGRTGHNIRLLTDVVDIGLRCRTMGISPVVFAHKTGHQIGTDGERLQHAGGLLQQLEKSVFEQVFQWLRRVCHWTEGLGEKDGTHLFRHGELTPDEEERVCDALAEMARDITVDLTQIEGHERKFSARHAEALRAREYQCTSFQRACAGKIRRRIEVLDAIGRICSDSVNEQESAQAPPYSSCSFAEDIRRVDESGIVDELPSELRRELHTLCPNGECVVFLSMLAQVCRQSCPELEIECWRRQTPAALRSSISSACRNTSSGLARALQQVEAGLEPENAFTASLFLFPISSASEADSFLMLPRPTFLHEWKRPYAVSPVANRRLRFLGGSGRRIATAASLLQSLVCYGELEIGVIGPSVATYPSFKVKHETETVRAHLEDAQQFVTFGVLTQHELPLAMRDDVGSRLREACGEARRCLRFVSERDLQTWLDASQRARQEEWFPPHSSTRFLVTSGKTLKGVDMSKEGDLPIHVARMLLPWVLEERRRLSTMLVARFHEESVMQALCAVQRASPGLLDALHSVISHAGERKPERRSDGSVLLPLQLFSALPQLEQQQIRSYSGRSVGRGRWPPTLCHLHRPTGESRVMLRLHADLASVVMKGL